MYDAPDDKKICTRNDRMYEQAIRLLSFQEEVNKTPAKAFTPPAKNRSEQKVHLR